MTSVTEESPDVGGQRNAPKKSSHNNSSSSVPQNSHVQVDIEKMDGIKSSGNDCSEFCDVKDLDNDAVFIDDIFVEMCEDSVIINTGLQIKDYFSILRALFTIKEKMEVDDNGQKDNRLTRYAIEEEGRNVLTKEMKEKSDNAPTEEVEERKENANWRSIIPIG